MIQVPVLREFEGEKLEPPASTERPHRPFFGEVRIRPVTKERRAGHHPERTRGARPLAVPSRITGHLDPGCGTHSFTAVALRLFGGACRSGYTLFAASRPMAVASKLQARLARSTGAIRAQRGTVAVLDNPAGALDAISAGRVEWIDSRRHRPPRRALGGCWPSTFRSTRLAVER